MFIKRLMKPSRSLRSWRTELCRGSCALVSVSVEHEDSPRMGAVRGVVLESQYLLEPSGTERTRLTHISRVDLRCGLTPSVLTVKVSINTAIINVLYLPFLVPGEDLQNGTTRPSVTCVSMKSRGSAPRFSLRIRRALRPRSEPQKQALSWVTPKGNHPGNGLWCLFMLLSHTEPVCTILYRVTVISVFYVILLKNKQIHKPKHTSENTTSLSEATISSIL